ncbi:MAG: hypothetical protein K940chlam8_00978 [Chlamydiae bacterium]|nr:hypothetical protein [Chlamydiota bacterium]
MNDVGPVQFCTQFLLTLPKGKSPLQKAAFASIWVLGGAFAVFVMRGVYRFTCKKGAQSDSKMFYYFTSKKFPELEQDYKTIHDVRQAVEKYESSSQLSEFLNFLNKKFKQLNLEKADIEKAIKEKQIIEVFLGDSSGNFVIKEGEIKRPDNFIKDNIIWVCVEFTSGSREGESEIYFAEFPNEIKISEFQFITPKVAEGCYTVCLQCRIARKPCVIFDDQLKMSQGPGYQSTPLIYGQRKSE